MVKKLSAFFYRFSTGWVALAGVLIFLVFSGLTLPVESSRMDAYAQGLGNPDTSFFYNSSMLLKMAEAYGDAGRTAFLRARWGFDLAFPLIYTFFYITSLSFILKKSLAETSSLRLFNLFPLLGLIFDLAENTATSVVMTAYPLQKTWAQVLAPIFTPLKWIFVITSAILLFIGLLLWLKKGIINSYKNKH